MLSDLRQDLDGDSFFTISKVFVALLTNLSGDLHEGYLSVLETGTKVRVEVFTGFDRSINCFDLLNRFRVLDRRRIRETILLGLLALDLSIPIFLLLKVFEVLAILILVK